MRMHFIHFLYSAVLICIFSMAIVQSAYAQDERVYFNGSSAGRGIRFSVFIDSELPINAFSFEIMYDEANLQFVSSNESDSIVDIWETFPPLAQQGALSLQGGMIRPFSGMRGKIIELAFRMRDDTPSRIYAQNPFFYIADGKGTEIVPTTESFELDVGMNGIEKADGMKRAESIEDHISPRFIDVRPVAVPGEDIRLVSFQVKDEETGVKEITVSVRRWIVWQDVGRAQNPVEVSEDVWSVRLVAEDNAGNAAIYTVIIWQSVIKKVFIIFIILGVCVLGMRMIARVFLARRRDKRRT